MEAALLVKRQFIQRERQYVKMSSKSRKENIAINQKKKKKLDKSAFAVRYIKMSNSNM